MKTIEDVMKDIAEMITSPEGLGMASRRITVSTAGIAKMIKKLGDDQVKFNLALSLHVANNEKRSKLMSINDSNPLEMLADALKQFHQKTKKKLISYVFQIITTLKRLMNCLTKSGTTSQAKKQLLSIIFMVILL